MRKIALSIIILCIAWSNAFTNVEINNNPIRNRSTDSIVDYTQGTFFINEDSYGHSNSTVNFLTSDGEWVYRVFQKENSGKTLGSSASFGTIYGDKFYIVCKQAKDVTLGSRLTVCDAKTMKCLKQFENIAVDQQGNSIADGRSFLGVNEHKGYIGTSNGIWIYDIDNMTIGNQIAGSEEDTNSLYLDQIGTMLSMGGKVFALHQSKGIFVIDSEKDEIISTIGGYYGAMVLSKDGNLWLSCTDSAANSVERLLQLNPYTLDTLYHQLPEEMGIPNTWTFWTVDGFCASTQENVLYWKNDAGWSNSTQIYRFDIATTTVQKFYDFSGTEWSIYGAGFRVHPETDEIYCTLFKSWGVEDYQVVRISNDGELLDTYSMEAHNWYPTMPVFPNNKLGTEINTVISSSFSVFPNPTADMVHFTTIIGEQVSLFDMSGKRLYQTYANQEQMEINLQSLTSGIYFLRIGDKVAKIVKR